MHANYFLVENLLKNLSAIFNFRGFIFYSKQTNNNENPSDYSSCKKRLGRPVSF